MLYEVVRFLKNTPIKCMKACKLLQLRFFSLSRLISACLTALAEVCSIWVLSG